MKSACTKIAVITLFVLFSSCNAVKRVPEDGLLLTKNTLLENGNEVSNDTLESLFYQKPNSRLLRTPIRLHIYNLAAEDPEANYKEWLEKKPKRHSRLAKFLSEKQVQRLGRSFWSYGIHNALKNTGEPPTIIDPLKTSRTASRLKSYYNSKGYFNSEVDYTIIPLEHQKKRGEVSYTVNTGKPYYLDTITTTIASHAVDSIYQLHKKQSFIKTGNQYDLLKFGNERTRLTTIFRNSGLYTFQQSSINFEIARDTTQNSNDFKMPVTLFIENLTRRDNGRLIEIPYQVHHIKKINIYADYTFQNQKDNLDSISHNNYTIFYHNKLRYRPKALTDAMAISAETVYTDNDRALTYRQINNLRTFKYPNIEYKYIANDSLQNNLEANIYLSPIDRFSLEFNTDVSHSNIQDFGISFSTSLISRNIFRGAETLELSARGTLGSQKNAANSDQFFNISEIGGDIKLSFPRIFFPIKTNRWIPKYMLPETRLQFGTSIQENIGLDKRSFNGITRYSWSPSTTHKNVLEMLNSQFINNMNVDNFFNVYQSTYNRLNSIAKNYPVNPDYLDDNGNLSINTGGAQNFIMDVQNNTLQLSDEDNQAVRSIEERRVRLTDNNLIFASNFTFTQNNRTNFTDNNFSQFRAKLELAGNILSALAQPFNFEKNEHEKYLVFGVQFSQYVKTEFDYIKYWQINRENVLAFRAFAGIAIPYGNSSNIPFSRSYFAGGSNDNRAWQAYSLGPGSSGSTNDFNEANMKLAFNLEYRFPIFGGFKGALFADAGNIWNILDDVNDPSSQFQSIDSIKDIALGSGFGLRYDFSFFVLRFDTGFKTYNPALPTGQRWFKHYNFSNAVFNIGINYPF